jgi:hypothetical protein
MHSLWAYLSRDPASGRCTLRVREPPGRIVVGEVPADAVEALLTAIRAIAGLPADADIDLQLTFNSARNARTCWAPGLALPYGATGYTLKEARSAVGSGWAVLVDAAYRRVTDAGYSICQVKEKFAGLRVYFYGPINPPPEGVQLRSARTLYRYLAWLETTSRRTCEACGAPGTECEHLRWRRTLCPSCAWRWQEGATSWEEIRGDWPPPSI